MKYSLILAFILSVFTFIPVSAETLEVDVTKLSQSELLIYQKMKQSQESSINLENLTPERIDKYGQIGKAFGTAFKECWGAVSSDAERFGQSSAGKWAMIMVSWKIMGQDAIGIVNQFIHYTVGILLFTTSTVFFIYIFRRNCIQHPILKSKTKIGFLTVKKEYGGMASAIHSDEVLLVYALCYIILIAISFAVMFS